MGKNHCVEFQSVSAPRPKQKFDLPYCSSKASRTRGAAAGYLGNLAGRAVETIPHPTLKTDKGRTARVPCPDPDFTSPAMPVPAFVPELVLLGNGDSEPILTRNAMERVKRRHARDCRLVRVRLALAGVGFDDLMKDKTND